MTENLKRKVHVFQHVPFEGLGCIADWLEQHSLLPVYTRFFTGDPLPVLEKNDALIIMGGPMSSNDEGKFPWLKSEKKFIREAIRQNIPVLGICLGAQLIAGALGSRIYQNRVKEIGWFPVQSLSAANDAFKFPPEFMAFHWHGETYDLPADTVQLACSAACQQQAFQLKRHVIGLQFHLEITRQGIKDLIANCRVDIRPGPFVQTEQELCLRPDRVYHHLNKLMDDILTYLF